MEVFFLDVLVRCLNGLDIFKVCIDCWVFCFIYIYYFKFVNFVFLFEVKYGEIDYVYFFVWCWVIGFYEICGVFVGINFGLFG